MPRHAWEDEDGPNSEQRPTCRARHSWEDAGFASRAAHSCEPRARLPLEESSGEEDVDPEGTVEEAAECFAQLLLDKYFESSLSAQSVCTLAYYASKAGVTGLVEELALKPGAGSGNFQRHLKKVLGFSSDDFYKLRVPGTLKHELGRTSWYLPTQPLHEVLMQEVEETPDYFEQLTEAIENDLVPPGFFEQPLVATSQGPVVPYALYMDGVAYSLTDTVVGVWAYSLATNKRHLLCLVRKKLVCKCGCRGWCTFWPVLAWLKWCCEALAEGVYPRTRHDGANWSQEDSTRAAQAGAAMAARAVCVFLKGDWAEFCERLGFPTWNSGLRPCFCCSASPDQFLSAAGVSLEAGPWHVNTDDDYEEACAKCEFRVSVDRPGHEMLCRLLRYDKRKDGSHGRALIQDVPNYRLLAGDRLEPCNGLRDVGEFDMLKEFPAQLVFWRVSEETLCQHRCPLWDVRLGLTPSLILGIDMMHTLHLGVMQEFAKEAVWVLLRANLWAPAPGLTEEERVDNNLVLLRNLLWSWYRERSQRHPKENLRRLQDLTRKMVGTNNNRRMKTKAAETWGFTLFLTETMHEHRAVLQADRLIAAGNAIIKFVSLTKEFTATLPAHAHQQMLDCVKALHSLLPENSRTPKLHLAVHLVQRARTFGNPKLSQTFRDEGLNKKLKMVCRHCHSANFEVTAFFKMRRVLEADNATTGS